MIIGRRGDVAFVLVVLVTLAAVLASAMVLVTGNRSIADEAAPFAHLSEDAAINEMYIVSASRMLGSSVIRANGENETLRERFIEKASAQSSLLAHTRGFYERVIAPGAVTFLSTAEGYELVISEIPVTVVHERYKLQRLVTIRILYDGDGSVHKVYKEYRT